MMIFSRSWDGGVHYENRKVIEWGHTYTEFINPSSIVDWKHLRKPSFFSLTTAILRTMKSNYISPSNHHDSPIRFLLLSKSGVNLGVLSTSPFLLQKVKNISSNSLEAHIIIGRFLGNKTPNVDVSTGFHCLM